MHRPHGASGAFLSVFVAVPGFARFRVRADVMDLELRAHDLFSFFFFFLHFSLLIRFCFLARKIIGKGRMVTSG